MKNHRLRRARRGAIFVEAIIVISFFTVCFLGVLYFRELYLGKMHVQRLARASAMARAMSACKADASAGLEKDVPRPLREHQEDGPGPPFELKLPGSGPGVDLANKVLSELEGSLGGGLLGKITVVDLTTSASATTRKDLASPRQGFESEVSSQSFVFCMDPVSDDQFGEIIPHVEDVFGSIL